MSRKHMARPSTSRVNREMQTKTPMSYHYTSNGQKFKSEKIPNVGERYRSTYSLPLW